MDMKLNKRWEQHIIGSGVDFVHFVDISMIRTDTTKEYTSAILFGKALSKEYICAIRNNEQPKTKEIFNVERKMDALAVKFATQIEDEGYKSIGKLKAGILPHKTVALRAGLGFIGKNNLLITQQYGCAVMFGKVLTTAPFITVGEIPKEPQCGSCTVCVEVCPTKALLGKSWSITTTRDEILTRKLCTLCHKCMVCCPYTEGYLK
ncbi:MAG: hypothetical protein ACM3SM_09745 [Bacteroidota bacterium]